MIFVASFSNYLKLNLVSTSLFVGSAGVLVGAWMDDGNGCSKVCNDLISPLPFKTQIRQCLEPDGNCGTISLTRAVECNRDVGCNGKTFN